MESINTSDMGLVPYTPQAKPTKQEFLVILPSRVAQDNTENIQLEIMQPIAQNIHASVFNYIDQNDIYNGIIYDYIYFNTNNYFLIPLKRSILPSCNITFIEEENNNVIGGDNLSNLSWYPIIEGSWYILHYLPIDVTDNEYFTSTEVYFTPDNLPIPDLSAWEPEITSVPQNTIVNAEDTITSYIYTEDGWEVFANNTPNITDSETELFIRGLVYGEDVGPHEDEGGTTGEDETGEGGAVK